MLQTQTQVERSLLSRVMGWLGLSLALTAGGVYLWGAGLAPNIPWILYLLVALGLIFGIQAAANSKNQSLAVGLFAVFSVVEGLFIAPVVYYYLQTSPDAVGNALLGTVGIFFVAAAVVYLTSVNLAAWGKYLLGALLVGISYAKALAFALDKPLIAVNHLEGHIHAVLLEERQKGNHELRFPVLARLVDRGDPGNRTCDIGSMELYAASVIASDPFVVARSLQESTGR